MRNLKNKEGRIAAINQLHDEFKDKLIALGFSKDISVRIASNYVEIGKLKENPRHRSDMEFSSSIAVHGKVYSIIGSQEPHFSISSIGSVTPENKTMVSKLKLAMLTLENYDTMIEIATNASKARETLYKEIEEATKDL